eukprot:981076-Alexandrium_andersonii.AAC.1
MPTAEAEAKWPPLRAEPGGPSDMIVTSWRSRGAAALRGGFRPPGPPLKAPPTRAAGAFLAG